MLNLIDFTNSNVFSACTFIMLYFNVKFYITYNNLKKNTSFFRSNRKIRVVFASVLNILHLLLYYVARDEIITIDGCNLVKTFFLFLMIDFLYVNFMKVMNYVFNFYEVLIFFILNWMFVAALIEVLFVAFPTYYDHTEHYSFNFNNYFKSLFSVFVFLTGNNSPEMIMKNYPSNSNITIFFISVIWINNILVIGLLIGLSYYKMKLAMSQEIEKVYEKDHKKNVFEKLIIHPDAPKNFIKKLLKMHMEDNVQPFITFDKYLAEQENRKMKIQKASEYIFDLLRSLKSYEFFYSLIDIIIALYAIYVIQNKDFEKYQQFLYMILLCSVSILDFLHHLFFRDMSNLDLHWKSYFDFFLSLSIIFISVILFEYPNWNITLIKVWAFFCILKLFRFFIFYFRFDRKKLKKNIIYPSLKFISDIIMQLIVIYIIFASLGLNLFGGKINSFTMEVYNDEMETNYDYEQLNFNTFLNSLIFFFVVTLNNNWPVLANLCIVKTGEGERRLVKFIFVIFKLIVNYILLNSLVAFNIEIFHEYWKRSQGKLDEMKINVNGNMEMKDKDELSDDFREDVLSNFDERVME